MICIQRNPADESLLPKPQVGRFAISNAPCPSESPLPKPQGPAIRIRVTLVPVEDLSDMPLLPYIHTVAYS